MAKLVHARHENHNVPLGMVQLGDFEYTEADRIRHVSLNLEGPTPVITVSVERRPGATAGEDRITITLHGTKHRKAQKECVALMDRIATARLSVALQHHSGPLDC